MKRSKVEKAKAIAAMETLQQYCAKQDCDKCSFARTYGVVDHVCIFDGNCPADWPVEEFVSEDVTQP